MLETDLGKPQKIPQKVVNERSGTLATATIDQQSRRDRHPMER